MKTKIVIIFIIFLLLATGSFIIWQKPSLFQSKTFSIKNQTKGTFSFKDVSGFFSNNKKEAENFLLLGAPGQGNDAPDLTDTILIARLEPSQNKIFLFSLPRDLLVKIPNQENYTKLNALYAFNKKNVGQEFSSLIQKTEDITGLKINHFIFVDLETVKNIVDILGGINILVKKDIKDETFPGPNHSFQTFQIQAGWRYLDGETTLKYIRSRHSSNGDFDRISRQQEVLQVLKQKVLTLNFWDLKKIIEIYQSLSANIKTDLALWQIQNYWQETKSIPGENVIRNELSNQNLFSGGQILLGSELASIIKPKAGIENYEEIKKFISEQINFK